MSILVDSSLSKWQISIGYAAAALLHSLVFVHRPHILQITVNKSKLIPPDHELIGTHVAHKHAYWRLSGHT